MLPTKNIITEREKQDAKDMRKIEKILNTADVKNKKKAMNGQTQCLPAIPGAGLSYSASVASRTPMSRYQTQQMSRPDANKKKEK